MTKEKKATAERLYYVLGALFIAALITCNLIANKFLSVDLGFHRFHPKRWGAAHTLLLS